VSSIIHIITGLNDGGAEAVLFRLCTHDSASTHTVISLSGLGKYGPLLLGKGIPTFALNMRPGWPSPLAFLKLVRLLRSQKPHVVQTWMYHADLFGGLAARVAGVRAVVWGIRASSLDSSQSKIGTLVLIKFLARFSFFIPSQIVVCSKRAMGVHKLMGYSNEKMSFVPNGYDLLEFSPNAAVRDGFRANLRLESNMPLIGMVGRFDPQKDHANLLRALSIVKKEGIAFRCVLVGSNTDDKNDELSALIKNFGLEAEMLLLGSKDGISTVMNGLDLHVLSSVTEAFPNVVAEAMACGTPCVVTDVGDAALIVGDTGWVVPLGNATELAVAISAALTELKKSDWNSRCTAARDRIVQNFSIQKMADNYQKLWREAASTSKSQ
jgi:glycosyltransferase involved in cell wall biosynthesis